ncbi:MAG: hypothetical protein KA247_07135 [Bacteroidetes bacterium]|nr:hypothetical protein [Bacteroidota bacterium]
MSVSSSFQTLLKNPYIVYGFYFLFSIWFVGTWIATADAPLRSFEPEDGTEFSALMDGTATRPVAYRVLIPTIVHSFLNILPEASRREMANTIGSNGKIMKEMQRLNLSPHRIFEYAAAFLLVFILFFGTLIMLRAIILQYYSGDPIFIALFPCASVLLLPPFFGSGPHYIYDLPTLFFLTGGLFLMFNGRWIFYYLLFLAGCLNKETAIFLFAAFVFVQYHSMKRKEFFRHSILHMLIGTGAILIVRWIYAANPGTGMEFHLHANIHFLMMGYSVVSLLFILLALWMIGRGFSTIPGPIRNASVIVIPFLGVWSVGGLFYEPRAIYEVIFIANIFIVHTIFHTLWMKVQPNQSFL